MTDFLDVGTGAGLDADTLDGQHGSHYLDYKLHEYTSSDYKADLDVDHIITLSCVSMRVTILEHSVVLPLLITRQSKALQDLETELETKSGNFFTS